MGPRDVPIRETRHGGWCVTSITLLVGLWVEPCPAQPASSPLPSAPAAELPSDSPAPTAEAEEANDSSSAQSVGVAQFLLELAKDRFNRGVLEKNPAELERALDALRFGYSLSAAPALAFNAARVARELGHCAEARAWYETFLAREQRPERRQRAEHQLAGLAPCDPSQPTESVWVLPAQSVWVLPVPAWGLSSAQPATFAQLESSASEPAPSASRPWFWGVAGAAGVSAVLSGVFLVQAGSKDAELERLQPDAADPAASAERVQHLQAEGRAAQTRAQVFGAITAGLGVTAAVGLWVTRPRPDSELLLQASPSGAMASWRERF